MSALVLIGDEPALRKFSRLLRGPHPTAMTLEPIEGRPALTPVRTLRIDVATEGTVIIQIIDDYAAIRASAASYRQLADEVDLFVEHNDVSEPGAHTHIGPPVVLDESGLDLVLAGPVPDDA